MENYIANSKLLHLGVLSNDVSGEMGKEAFCMKWLSEETVALGSLSWGPSSTTFLTGLEIP